MITSKFTEFIMATSYNQLPDSVTKKAKDCFTDFLGVALKGSQSKSGEAIKNIIHLGDESTIIGHGRSSALEAGLANGIFAHSMDLDDGHRRAMLHPGACVIPAAFSMCESLNRSGKDLIESIVVGYQVAIALGMMINPKHRNKGFHSTGTCGTFGAAAAASKAMGLNELEITNALGLAGTQAAGLLESDHSGSMGKHLHAGKAAQSGILSALLAKNGFTGAHTILEDDEGFLKVMAGVNQGEIALSIDRYHISDVYFKIYPVCRHLHSSIDALLEIVKEEQVELYEIERITVNSYKIAAEHNDYHPTSTEALRQSLPVTLAVVLLNYYHGKKGINEFSYSPQDQVKIDDISRKIILNTDPTLDREYPQSRPSEVSISTPEGAYKRRVDLPYGEPENPLNKADIEWKFKNLNPEVDDGVLKVIEKADSYLDVGKFMDDLCSFL